MTYLKQDIRGPSRETGLSLSAHRSCAPPRRIAPSSDDLLGGRTFGSFASSRTRDARNLSLINSKSGGPDHVEIGGLREIVGSMPAIGIHNCLTPVSRTRLHNLAAPPSRNSRGCLSSLLVGRRVTALLYPPSHRPLRPHPLALLRSPTRRRLDLDSRISPAAITRGINIVATRGILRFSPLSRRDVTFELFHRLDAIRECLSVVDIDDDTTERPNVERTASSSALGSRYSCGSDGPAVSRLTGLKIEPGVKTGITANTRSACNNETALLSCASSRPSRLKFFSFFSKRLHEKNYSVTTTTLD